MLKLKEFDARLWSGAVWAWQWFWICVFLMFVIFLVKIYTKAPSVTVPYGIPHEPPSDER